MPFIVIDHFPPTVAEEADLVRRGVIKHPLTSEQRILEEARAAARDRDRAVRQADAILAAARRG